MATQVTQPGGHFWNQAMQVTLPDNLVGKFVTKGSRPQRISHEAMDTFRTSLSPTPHLRTLRGVFYR